VCLYHPTAPHLHTKLAILWRKRHKPNGLIVCTCTAHPRMSYVGTKAFTALFAVFCYFVGTRADAGIGLIPTNITTTSLGGSNVGYPLITDVPSDFSRYPGEKFQSGRPEFPFMPRLNSPLASTPAASRMRGSGEDPAGPTNGVVTVTPSYIRFGGTCGSAEACGRHPALASYRQFLVTAGPVRRRRLRADGRSAWR
jgi:hypothetical protein